MVATSFITLASLLSLALAKPVSIAQRSSLEARGNSQSFDNFDNLDSLSNFDDFFGSNNFDGSGNKQILVEQQQTVCRQIDVVRVQQRLTVMREAIKRILVEQVCETESRVLLLQQFGSGVDSFGRDLRRQSGRDVTFDAVVANKVVNIFERNGKTVVQETEKVIITNSDLGFNGRNVGRNGVIAKGDNWNDNTSPQSVGKIYDASSNARQGSQNQNSTEPAETTSAADSESTSASSTDSASDASATAESTSSAEEASSTSDASSSESSASESASATESAQTASASDK